VGGRGTSSKHMQTSDADHVSHSHAPAHQDCDGHTLMPLSIHPPLSLDTRTRARTHAHTHARTHAGLRVAVIGQGLFGAETYKALRDAGHNIVGVFTIPDDKNGRADVLAQTAAADGIEVRKVKGWKALKKSVQNNTKFTPIQLRTLTRSTQPTTQQPPPRCAAADKMSSHAAASACCCCLAMSQVSYPQRQLLLFVRALMMPCKQPTKRTARLTKSLPALPILILHCLLTSLRTQGWRAHAS
jgi:hypothetical protein